MIIATFNCNSVRQRLEIILDWLAKNQPDVLALQETKVVDELFPKDPFEQAGWHVSFRGQKSYNGVAVITRDKPKAVQFGFQDGDDGESDTRFAYLQVSGIHVINTYVPQGQDFSSDKYQFKLEWFRRLRNFFETKFKTNRSRIVWVGDINVAPTPADVHDSKRIWPHVCHCQEIIDAYEAVRSWGFEDVFRKHLPDEGVFTFWDYRVRNALERNTGWRIDHVLATPALAKKSVDCFVDIEPRKAVKPSDHTFVAATFQV